MRKFFYKIIFTFFKFFVQFFNKLVIRNTCHFVLKCSHWWCIGSCTQYCCWMARTYQTGLCSWLHLCNDLMKTFGVFQTGGINDLTDHFKQNICFWIHGFSSYRKESTECIYRICMIKYFYPAHNTACLCIDLICQLPISIMSCIYISKYRF